MFAPSLHACSPTYGHGPSLAPPGCLSPSAQKCCKRIHPSSLGHCPLISPLPCMGTCLLPNSSFPLSLGPTFKSGFPPHRTIKTSLLLNPKVLSLLCLGDLSEAFDPDGQLSSLKRFPLWDPRLTLPSSSLSGCLLCYFLPTSDPSTPECPGSGALAKCLTTSHCKERAYI